MGNFFCKCIIFNIDNANLIIPRIRIVFIKSTIFRVCFGTFEMHFKVLQL